MQLYSLKSIRINLGLSLDEASKKIGISKYTLYNYEHYKTTPNSQRIKQIENAYGISYNEIRFVPTAKEKATMKKNCNRNHMKKTDV